MMYYRNLGIKWSRSILSQKSMKDQRYNKEALTISIYKCLWFLEKQKASHLSSYAQVNFPK